MSSTGENRDDNSPGRIGPGTDWIYYDSIVRRAIGESEARVLAASVRPPIPDGYPVGFNLYMAPDWSVDYSTWRNHNGDSQDQEAVIGSWEVDDSEMNEAEPSVVSTFQYGAGVPSVMDYPARSTVAVAPMTASAVADHGTPSEADVLRQFLR